MTRVFDLGWLVWPTHLPLKELTRKRVFRPPLPSMVWTWNFSMPRPRTAGDLLNQEAVQDISIDSCDDLQVTSLAGPRLPTRVLRVILLYLFLSLKVIRQTWSMAIWVLVPWNLSILLENTLIALSPLLTPQPSTTHSFPPTHRNCPFHIPALSSAVPNIIIFNP